MFGEFGDIDSFVNDGSEICLCLEGYLGMVFVIDEFYIGMLCLFRLLC